MTTHARLERMSEPWSLSRSFSMLVTFALAVLLGTWAASGEMENLILFSVWFAAVMIILFVQDYWWSPMLVICALSLSTMALGFPLGGMEIGVVILALTFPIKLAMKTLRKAEPEMAPGLLFWLLFAYVVIHAITILIYNKIDGAPQLRNIVKCYYVCITPLVFYFLLVRYCHLRTVRPTIIFLFFTLLFTVAVSMVTVLFDLDIEPFSDLRITVGWLDHFGAMGILRYNALYLFTGCIAFWPTVRSGPQRFLMAFGIVLGAVGVLAGSGRISTMVCVLAGVFFALIRGRLWLAIPFMVIAAAVSASITMDPDLYFQLPATVQRSIAPLNFSYQGAEVNADLAGSDEWHKVLRDRSIPYWMMDTTSFWLGHGFKSWDPTITKDQQDVSSEHMIDLAVEMGATENMFSCITNIYGLVGLILYGAFLISLAWTLYRGSRLAPAGSDARALCEFSFVNLVPTILFAYYYGYAPHQDVFYYALGIIAARPYLAKSILKSSNATAVPAFARPAFAEQIAGTAHRSV